MKTTQVLFQLKIQIWLSHSGQAGLPRNGTALSHDVIHIPYPDNHSTKQEKQECTEIDYHLYIGRHLPLPPQGLDPQASQCSGGSLHLDTGLFFSELEDDKRRENENNNEV